MENIKMTEVQSSNLAAVGYDDDSETLYVRFKGNRLYAFYGVSRADYEGLLAAESKGRYFAREIRGLHAYKYIGMPKDEEEEKGEQG